MKNDLSKLKRKDRKKQHFTSSLIEIANLLGLEITTCDSLEKLSDGGMKAFNRFLVGDDMIFFYPPNDGMPTCPFEFYKNGKRIITNQRAFEEICNLDDIILDMVRIFDKALDNNIVLDPYGFLLRIDADSDDDVITAGRFSITENTIWNHRLTAENFDIAKAHCINKFLDHFIGWNFGVSVNRNEELMNELETLNKKVIDMGLREFAGGGYEVFGSDDEVYKGVQHYTLPLYKVEAKTKVKTNDVQV